MERFPKRYSFREVEEKWQKIWEKLGLYRFNRDDTTRPVYTIDTPPPYPSGELHVGNALNFAYIDFVARYKRMRGYNVFFPQGWDCHGLPTEVRVEKTVGKSKKEIPPDEFIELSRKFTLEWIKPMKESLKKLGCSIDWTTEYMTMDPDYWRRTQLSFILMYKRGLIYRGEHPVIWCPRCETAIAEAEVEYSDITRELYYYKFKLEDGRDLIIASTRPELLASCVAVAINPEDARYVDLRGKKAIVPIYEREVPVIAEEEVDPSFGTGAVMVCTYGDKTDVKWHIRHKLPTIISIDENGRMTDVAGDELKGLRVDEARKKIVEMLRKRGLLVKTEKILSSVGTCWRCHTPVEIIPRKQWFIKTRELNPIVLEKARKIRWIPPYALKRLEDWIKSLDWDWVISRQRLFATPIPAFYCEDCGNVVVAEPGWLPIDPRKDKPKIDRCPRCGSSKFVGEKDVLDTWMDSSITAAVHAGWPDNMDKRLFPADLQPNGYDIIRTWDYYLLVRGVALFGDVQFTTALINGMVRGTDGRMMHKSYGNYVSLMEVIEKYGADSFRLWVASSVSTGSDVRFSWEGLEYTRRFLTKVWNAARFIKMSLRDFNRRKVKEDAYRITDLWIRELAKKLVKEVTEALENFDFMRASNLLIDFVWHKFCDHYLESVKYRVSKKYADEDKGAAQSTLYDVFLDVLRLLAVFAPHLSEEIYMRIYGDEFGWRSITVAPWPQVKPFDAGVINSGDVVISAIAALRRLKHDKRLPLNVRIDEARIYVHNKEYARILERASEDIRGTIRADKLRILDGEGGELKVEEFEGIGVEIIA